MAATDRLNEKQKPLLAPLDKHPDWTRLMNKELAQLVLDGKADPREAGGLPPRPFRPKGGVMPLVRVCGWCGRSMGVATHEGRGETTGICQDCLSRLMPPEQPSVVARGVLYGVGLSLALVGALIALVLFLLVPVAEARGRARRTPGRTAASSPPSPTPTGSSALAATAAATSAPATSPFTVAAGAGLGICE